MSLFQKSVEKKYLNELDSVLVDSKYKDFQNYFGNPAIQENIRNSKEEQFQEGFLRELFVSVLGYTLNPQPNFNLTTELKNIANSKKADGAILKGEDAIAVIELKGTDTTDLDKIEAQAFGYKNHHPKCVYVITSNFEKLRFYIQNAVDHLDFDLFNLTREQFSLLWLCLAKDNLLGGLPLKIKESSVLQEEDITKNLYADYSKFREAIYSNLVKNNPETDKLLLFRKTQKLIDRFLFIFFAEDRLLVPPNSISQIIEKWKDDVDFGDAKPLYETFKKYFHVLNVGRPKSGNRQEIFAYNGGLFSEDEILDNIHIDDVVLYDHTLKLSQYNFETDVDVNILGHIFEHSLGEIENVQAEIKGEKVDSQKTKRKKDGIFYTPKYITKYIVENTVGKLCEEKRAALAIIDEEYAKGRKNRKKETIAALDKKLTDYRDWLLSLTILDPACGSGAFLNQALDFLITEHRKIDDLRAQLFGGGLAFSDITTDILEKNIYGVDINEESVEIAKLSLWLRTAQKGRKLNKLNNNIKCGNSLIDDPTVAGEKAFNWQNEFPEIFAKGGFDVVIGNPPYVRADSPGNTLEFREYLVKSNQFGTLAGKWDLYIPFIEQSIKLAGPKGKISLIIPDAYCHADYANKSLEWAKTNQYLFQIDYYPEFLVFQNVGVKSVIVHFQKNHSTDFVQRIHHSENSFSETILKSYPQSMRIDSKASILKNNSTYYLLNQICYSTKGIVGNSDEKKFQGEFEVGDLLSETKNETHPKLYFEGKDIGKWILLKQRWIEYGTERSPSKWSRKGFTDMFEGSPKIVAMRSPGTFPRLMLDENNGYFNESAIGFKRWIDLRNVNNNSLNKAYETEEERFEFEKISELYSYPFLLAILNSSVIRYELNTNRRSNIHIYPDDWKVLKIPQIVENGINSIASELEKKASLMLSLNKELQEVSWKLQRTIQRKFNLEDLPGKLQNWYLLSFKEFILELAKKKIKLTLADEAEWEDYFNEQKQKAQTLKAEIDKTDREIDRMVYELYGLTEEEIRIVEEST